MVILKYDSYEKFNKFKAINENDSQEDPLNLLRKEVQSDVSRCVSLILAKYPFFGEYLYDCRFLYDHPDINTMATDGKNIFISSKFAASLTDEQMIFILCHEILHIMLLHHLRMANKLGSKPSGAEANKWNYAADYEINPMLVGEGLLTADEVKNDIKGLYKEEYIGKACEVIYDELPGGEDGQDPPPGGQDFPVNIGYPVQLKNGKFGKISKINADGSYEIEEITEKEARSLANQIFG